MSGRATEPVYLAAPVRTPIGKFGGGLASLSAADLGTSAAQACLDRAGIDPAEVDEVIFGHARQAGGGPNTARQIGFRVGVPVQSPAQTINQACGSGLQTILAAARSLITGEADVCLVGGTESMSNTPYLLPRARWGYRLGHAEVVDAMYKDGFRDPLSELIMGETAEELAQETGIDREQADAFAARSQQRCEDARGRGRFVPEIAPIDVPGRKGTTRVEHDEHPRDSVTPEGLAKLPTVFRDDGTVTAGNASGITDGAAALLVLSAAAVERLDVTPVARLIDWEVAGVDPRIMGIGPVPAVKAIMERGVLGYEAIDQVEINEAFASQVLACLTELPFAPEQVNPDGGAIALGHPIGCTGARIMVTLLHGLTQSGGRRGLATLCVSGGMGLGALVERV